MEIEYFDLQTRDQRLGIYRVGTWEALNTVIDPIGWLVNFFIKKHERN